MADWQQITGNDNVTAGRDVHYHQAPAQQPPEHELQQQAKQIRLAELEAKFDSFSSKEKFHKRQRFINAWSKLATGMSVLCIPGTWRLFQVLTTSKSQWVALGNFGTYPTDPDYFLKASLFAAAWLITVVIAWKRYVKHNRHFIYYRDQISQITGELEHLRIEVNCHK